MIAGFVYRPILTDLAVDWAKGRMKHLKKQIFRIMLVIMVGTIAVEALSGTVILPVLEWLYAVKELEHYRSEFCIMLMAGGLNAGVTFMGFMITIMRKQNHMIWIYAITFTAALFVPDIFVKRYQFMGAAVSFLVLIFLQFFMLLFVYLGGLKINEKGDWDS